KLLKGCQYVPRVIITDKLKRSRSWDRPRYAFRGGLRGAGASSTDSKIAANIDRGFCPKKRSAAVVPSGRVRKKLWIAVRHARFLGRSKPAIGLREASVPEGMVALHGIGLSGGGWRCMWPGCILGSSLTYRALTLCPYLSINMSVGNGWGWGQGSLWQRRWPWKR